MEIVKAILSRSSARRLEEPGPSENAIEVIMSCGASAPDHGRLQPWRFVVITGNGRERLGDAFADDRKLRSPEANETVLQAERKKALRAPTIIAVASRPQLSKIPVSEQSAAVAAGVQNMFLAALDLGFGAMWKTGDAARSEIVKAAIGLEPDDEIIAFLYLGTLASANETRAPQLEGRVAYLSG